MWDQLKSLLASIRARGTRERPAGEMISCEEALAHVHEYLDGELVDIRPEQVAEHFRICSRCYPHLALEQAFREALQRACRGEEAPPELKRSLARALEEEGRRVG